MAAFVVDWLNLAIRWAHLVVGIGWIGTSFYFIALDLSLRQRERMAEGVYGTAWEVHGGGFYHVEKYLVAPKTLPPDLVWFKWEAYLTWVTGLALLIVQYYWNAGTFLINPAVMPLLPGQAIVISLLGLAAGWFIYDWLCKSPIGGKPTVLAVLVFVLIVFAAYVFTHVFSGRGAMIEVGAIIGTMMAVNVFGIIIPNQKKITAALIAGRAARSGARRDRQAALSPQQLPDAAGPRPDGEQPLPDAVELAAGRVARGGADPRRRRIGPAPPQPP